MGYIVANKTVSKKGNWTKDLPTEPGWYKAIDEDDHEIQFVKITERDFRDIRASQIFDFYTHWWSQPEVLPPLPEGDN